MPEFYGGCSNDTRGSAAAAREDSSHAASNYGSEARQSANSSVHCQNTTDNCSNATNWNSNHR
jgi:hypothetical protein